MSVLRSRALVLVDLARGGLPATGRRARLALSLRRTYRTRAEAIERRAFKSSSGRSDRSRMSPGTVSATPVYASPAASRQGQFGPFRRRLCMAALARIERLSPPVL